MLFVVCLGNKLLRSRKGDTLFPLQRHPILFRHPCQVMDRQCISNHIFIRRKARDVVICTYKNLFKWLGVTAIELVHSLLEFQYVALREAACSKLK